MKSTIFALFAICFLYPHCLSAPIDVNLNDKSNDEIDFNLLLPNNDTVKISLSFRLFVKSIVTDDSLTPTTASNEPATSYAHLDLSSSSENDAPKETDVEVISPEQNVVTIEEAIEGFRQDLINKERDIGGIIESDRVFYRHFKLNFEDDKSLKVRCTYDSNYQHKSLRISCYEFHELAGERILSNGEIERYVENDTSQMSNISFVDLRKMQQTYNMDIM